MPGQGVLQYKQVLSSSTPKHTTLGNRPYCDFTLRGAIPLVVRVSERLFRVGQLPAVLGTVYIQI